MDVRNLLTRLHRRYAAGQERPLGGYLLSLSTYLAFSGVLVFTGRSLGARLPRRIGLGDVALLVVATHKASRLLTKEAVTSPLRAPFTRYEGSAGEAELHESVPAGGPRHAVGELLTCPFCAAMWIATALAAGLVTAPRATRLVTTVLTTVAGSDFLQLLYDAAKALPARTAGNVPR